MINNAVSESILVAGQGGTAVFRQCSFSVGVRNNLILLLVEWFAANDHLQAMELLWCRRVQEVVRQLHKTKSDLDFFFKNTFWAIFNIISRSAASHHAALRERGRAGMSHI